MKRVFAILLFSVHLFNLAGYRLLFCYLQEQNGLQTLRHIERGNYADEDLVLVKIPVLLPYSTNWKEYERYDGEIEWGGVRYNYVKRRIFNDTLFLLCLPDIKGTQLADAHQRYAGQINDHPAFPQKGKERSAKLATASAEYLLSQALYTLTQPAIVKENQQLCFSASLMETDLDRVIQPPDAPAFSLFYLV
ncbi:MAG: hypothetical protein ACTHLE_08450 [Agriterribacter sp.]